MHERKSSSSLFLMELIIVLFFFLLTAAICIQVLPELIPSAALPWNSATPRVSVPAPRKFFPAQMEVQKPFWKNFPKE